MIIAPSVLSLDYSRLQQQMSDLNHSSAKWIHFDVMDGHFVPNLSFGPDLLKGMKRLSTKVFDVHIMVEDPFFFAPIFIKAGAEYLTFHYEAIDPLRINELVELIHQLGAKAGISVKPNTDVLLLMPYLKVFDLVLIMSVEPGFGGQLFDERALDKIEWLAWQKRTNHYTYLIQVDGGINHETAILAKNKGAEVLVSGSYLFKGDLEANIQTLL